MVGEEALGEERLFDLAAFGERQFSGGFDGGDGGDGSEEAALFFGDGLARGGKYRRVVGCVAKLFVALASFGCGLGGDFAGKGDCAGEKLAFDDAIDDAALQSFRGLYGIAGGAHFYGFRDAREAGKALRAGRARDDAEFYFGLADLRGGNGDAVVAGHGYFEAAAESRAVNGDDHGFKVVFDFQEKREQAFAAGLCRKSFCRIL